MGNRLEGIRVKGEEFGVDKNLEKVYFNHIHNSLNWSQSVLCESPKAEGALKSEVRRRRSRDRSLLA